VVKKKYYYTLFRVKKHKNGKNVPDWELSVPDWPRGGLYSLPSLKIPSPQHTDISLSFVFFHSEQDMRHFITKFGAQNIFQFKVKTQQVRVRTYMFA
jgi:hypothetical protein